MRWDGAGRGAEIGDLQVVLLGFLDVLVSFPGRRGESVELILNGADVVMLSEVMPVPVAVVGGAVVLFDMVYGAVGIEELDMVALTG